jgi:hypothetical protein
VGFGVAAAFLMPRSTESISSEHLVME